MSQIMLKLYKISKYNYYHSNRYNSNSTKKSMTDSNIFQMLKFVKEEKYRLTGAVGLLFISSGVTLSVPLIIGKVIDFISSGKVPNEMLLNILQYLDFKSFQSEDFPKEIDISKRDMTKIGVITMGFFVIGGLANFGRFYLIQTAGQRIIKKLRNRLYTSLMYKPVEFYDRNQSGELISRLTYDTSLVGQGLSTNISNGLRSGLQTGLGIGMMVYVSPHLSLLSTVILPPVMGFTLIFGRYIRTVSNNLQQSIASSSEKANESLSAIRTVKAFCNEKKEIKEYQATISNVLDNAYREALLRGSFFGLMGMSGNILIVSMLFCGGSLISTGQLTIGELSSFLLYAAYATVSMAGIGGFYTELMKAVGAGARLWPWMTDEPSRAVVSGNVKVLPLKTDIFLGDIKFQNVTFSYPTRPDHIILDHFSLCVPKGKLTAIVGSSGCGKSSIVSLLLKFYDINSGDLLIGDHRLCEIDHLIWKQKVAVVLQDPVLFSSTIAENIAYGSKSENNIKMSDIERIANLAQVMEFAQHLPDGLDTKIGERGALLSGGQRQRIAIARALMSNPDIVILDEAMSALDSKNEWLLQQAINEIFKDRTVITISHRLAFLKSAHQIAVINKGKIVQLGSFKELSECDVNTPQGNLFKNLLSNVF